LFFVCFAFLFFEVILADNSFIDGIFDVIGSFSEKLNVKVVFGGLPAAARNSGASLSCAKDYDVLVFLDSDTVVEDDFINCCFHNYGLVLRFFKQKRTLLCVCFCFNCF